MGPREFYGTISSTQDRAIELARQGASSGTRVVASSQSRGRGRLGHSWVSPAGAGLHLSLVLAAPAPRRSLLSLGVGAVLSERLRERYGIHSRLKWPNDLLVAAGPGPPRKISGILIDEVPSPSFGTAWVVGIGINVARDLSGMPGDLRDRVASLGQLTDPTPPLSDVEELAVGAAEEAARQLGAQGGAELLLARCRASLYGVGRSARVDGKRIGIIEGIGEEGELWLVRGPDRVAIRAGDLAVEDGP